MCQATVQGHKKYNGTEIILYTGNRQKIMK